MSNIISDQNEMKDGKVELMGMNIDITQILGQKIIDQYIAQITPEQMEDLMKYISANLFEEKKVWEDGEYSIKFVVKQTEKDRWGSPSKETSIGDIIKQKFNNRIREELVKKVDEIIATEDYQKKIDDIANELVEYATNGYKEDMKIRIRERLVNDVVDPQPYYNGVSLQAIIHSELQNMMR